MSAVMRGSSSTTRMRTARAARQTKRSISVGINDLQGLESIFTVRSLHEAASTLSF